MRRITNVLIQIAAIPLAIVVGLVCGLLGEDPPKN